LRFATGLAKKHEDLTQVQVQDLMDSPGVRNARDLYTKKGCQDVTDVAASFGVFGGAAPGHSIKGPNGSYLVGQDGQFALIGGTPIPNPTVIAHPTRQILGSYNIDIKNNGNGAATFDVFNEMTYNSLTLHFGRNFPTGEPFGNTDLHGSWTENIVCY